MLHIGREIECGLTFGFCLSHAIISESELEIFIGSRTREPEPEPRENPTRKPQAHGKNTRAPNLWSGAYFKILGKLQGDFLEISISISIRCARDERMMNSTVYPYAHPIIPSTKYEIISFSLNR